MNVDLDGDLRPYVVVPMCDVPAGKMPRNAVGMVGRAVEMGLWVRSSYAVALVPGVLRKVAGFARIEGGEGADAKGGGMQRVTVTLESVVVRFRDAFGWSGYASWHCVDGGSWSFECCWVRAPGSAPRRLTWDGIYV